MKHLLLASFFIAGTFFAHSQSASGTRTGTAKNNNNVKKTSTQVRGTGQYHGSKDTTPGSPMGTGGAGGSEMSGSPAGSASKTALQKSKAAARSNEQSGNNSTPGKKGTAKGKG
jgi:hypothetical protein